MRPLALLAMLLPMAAGCLGDASFGEATDCSSASDHAVAVQRSLLLPRGPADAPYEEDGDRVAVHARAGQDITALATWSVAGGQAEAAFDGPAGHQVATERTWTVTAQDVPEGDYSIGLAGAPFAFEVVYTLQIVASGCTPA